MLKREEAVTIRPTATNHSAEMCSTKTATEQASTDEEKQLLLFARDDGEQTKEGTMKTRRDRCCAEARRNYCKQRSTNSDSHVRKELKALGSR